MKMARDIDSVGNGREGVDLFGRTASEYGYTRGDAVNRRTVEIDLGLALLMLVAKPGEALGYDDIAAWCGCSSSAIQLIELKALKKLRNRLHFMHDARLEELMEQFFFARRPAEATPAQLTEAR